MSYNSFAFLENDTVVSPVKASNKATKAKEKTFSEPAVKPVTPPMQPVEDDDEDMDQISLDAMKIVFAERGFTPEQVERAYAATVSKEGHADIAKILTALEEARDSSPSAQNSPLLTASEGSDVTVTPTAGKQGKNTAPVVAVRADDDIYFLPPGANATVARLPGVDDLVFAADVVPAENTNDTSNKKKTAKNKAAKANKAVTFSSEPVSESSPSESSSAPSTPASDAPAPKSVLKTSKDTTVAPASVEPIKTETAPVPEPLAPVAAPITHKNDTTPETASPTSTPAAAIAALSQWKPHEDASLAAAIADTIATAASTARTSATATPFAQHLVENALAEHVVKALLKAHLAVVEATPTTANTHRNTLSEPLLASSARLLSLAYGVALGTIQKTLAQLADVLTTYPKLTPELNLALKEFGKAIHLSLCAQRPSNTSEEAPNTVPSRWGSAQLAAQAGHGDALHQLLSVAEMTAGQTTAAFSRYYPLVSGLSAADSCTHDMQLAFHLLEKRCCDKVTEIDRRLNDVRKHAAAAAAAHSEATALSAQARAPVEQRKRELQGQLSHLVARREQLQRELDAVNQHISNVEASLAEADTHTGHVAAQFIKREQETETLLRARTSAVESVEAEQRVWGAVRQLTVAAYHVAAADSNARVSQLNAALEKHCRQFITAVVTHLGSAARLHSLFAQRVSVNQTQLNDARAHKIQAVTMAMPPALIAQHTAVEQQLMGLVQADTQELAIIADQASKFIESIVRPLTTNAMAIILLYEALRDAQLPFSLGNGGNLLQTAYRRAIARQQEQTQGQAMPQPAPQPLPQQPAQQPQPMQYAQPQQPQQPQQPLPQAQPQQQPQQQAPANRSAPRMRAAQTNAGNNANNNNNGNAGANSAPSTSRNAGRNNTPAAVNGQAPATAKATVADAKPSNPEKDGQRNPNADSDKGGRGARGRGGRSREKSSDPAENKQANNNNKQANNNNKPKTSPAPAAAAPAAAAPAVAARPAWAAPKAPSERFSLFE